MSEASPARGQSPVGNVGGAGSWEPLQGRDGVYRRVSPRIPRIGAELGAWSRPRPADMVRGRGERGDMFGRGSYAIVRRCKSSIFFVAIRSAVEVSASSLTHWCSSEVPIDAARCRYSVHWRDSRFSAKHGVKY